MLQSAIALTIVILAAAYASWRVYRVITRADNPCAGCEGCALKKEMRKRKRKDKEACRLIRRPEGQ